MLFLIRPKRPTMDMHGWYKQNEKMSRLDSHVFQVCATSRRPQGAQQVNHEPS